MARVLAVVLAALVAGAVGCADIPPDPLHVESGTLTVDNHTANDWMDVEIWINRYYRVAVPKIAAHSRFQVRLDSFVSGYSQRFDIGRAVIKDLRLTAKQPDGTPLEVTREPNPGLAGLGAKGKS
jgi:hypothetical protein